MSTHQEGAVVTPEAVRLALPEADVGSRGVAWLLDIAIVGVVLIAIQIGAIGALGALGLPEWAVASLSAFLLLVPVLAYPITFETATRGRTLGKMALGIRVVTVEGGPVGFRHAALRGVLGLVDFQLTFGVAALVSALVSRRGRRLGDFAAGTVVIRQRRGGSGKRGRPREHTFTVPPQARDYAETVDVAALRAEDYQRIRTFLVRAPRMRSGPRQSLAGQLAGDIAARLDHTPPSGMPAELFLQVVAARAQARWRGDAGDDRGQNHSEPAAASRGAEEPDGHEAVTNRSDPDRPRRDETRTHSGGGGFAAPE